MYSELGMVEVKCQCYDRISHRDPGSTKVGARFCAPRFNIPTRSRWPGPLDLARVHPWRHPLQFSPHLGQYAHSTVSATHFFTYDMIQLCNDPVPDVNCKLRAHDVEQHRRDASECQITYVHLPRHHTPGNNLSPPQNTPTHPTRTPPP